MIARILNFFRNLHHWQWSGHVVLCENRPGWPLVRRFFRPGDFSETPPPKLIVDTSTGGRYVDTGKYDHHGARIYVEGHETYRYVPGTE